MAQIETHIPAINTDAFAFRAFSKLVRRIFGQIGDRQADTLAVQDRLSQPSMESHMLWDHGMTRGGVSRMLDHTHR